MKDSTKTIRSYSKKLQTTQKKLEKAKLKLKKLKQKKKQLSVSELKKKVQRVVNAYVRQRDSHLLCISCQKRPITEAGHFWPQGSKGALRYHLDNINGQCVTCNHHLHGNLLEYRLNLIKKIGKERVDWLDEHHNDIKKWTREELEELHTQYSLLLQGKA